MPRHDLLQSRVLPPPIPRWNHLMNRILSRFTLLVLIASLELTSPAQSQQVAPYAKATEDDRAIKIETDKLEAVIPKKNPKQWMTGIEKGSFLDKTTGFREVGDGLMVIDWLMEAGSDEAWSDKVIAPDGHGVGRYTWHENETDPARKAYALHGPRQQPSQAHGRGAAALPPDEAGPARGHPRQGLRRGEDDLQVRVRRPRPQARLAVDATDRLSQGRAVLRPDGQDRQRQRLGGDVPPQRHAGLRPPREGRHVQRDVPQLPERPEGGAHSRRASSSRRFRPT